tara:strand:+ start:478 stop:915 length:438 start_codon:yes stop_codon:yes gene_type:complete
MYKIILFILTTILMACGSAEKTVVTFDDLIVYAPRAGSSVTAGFTNISNPTAQAITVNNITSPQFNIVEVHETIIDDNGVAKMIKIEKLNIGSKQSIELKPGGKHLMLIDAKKAISEGEEINLIVELSNNQILRLNTPAISRFSN